MNQSLKQIELLKDAQFKPLILEKDFIFITNNEDLNKNVNFSYKLLKTID